MNYNNGYITSPFGYLFIVCGFLIITTIQLANSYTKCFKTEDFKVLWSKHIGAQFISSPLVVDITVGSQLEVLALSAYGDLTVLHGNNGEHVKDTSWPIKVETAKSNFHSCPILFDVNGDSIKDVVVLSSKGDFSVYDFRGKSMSDADNIKYATTKLPDIFIKKNWFEVVEKIPLPYVKDFKTLDGLIESDINIHHIRNQHNDYVRLSPHVYASAILEDTNDDLTVEELVIPVTYQVSDEVTAADSKPLDYNPDNYLVSAIVVFNLTSFQTIGKYFTEVDKRTSEYPPFGLVSPLVLCSTSRFQSAGKCLPQILFPTSGRKITRVNHNGIEVDTPFHIKGISEALVAEDLSFDEMNRLEFVYAEKGGRVVCVDSGHKQLWEVTVAGEVTGVTVLERKTVDGALVKMLVIASTAGKVWLVNGKDGRVLPRWPVKFGRGLKGPPSVLQLLPDGQMYVAVVDIDGYLHMATIDQVCKVSISLGETSIVGVISADLDPELPGVELLVATTHGSLIAIGLDRDRISSGEVIEEGVTDNMFNSSLLSLHSSGRSHNSALHSGHVGCVITSLHAPEPDGATVRVEFSVFDHTRDVHNPSRAWHGVWTCAVYEGSRLAVVALAPPRSPHAAAASSSQPPHAHGHVIIGSHSVSFRSEKLGRGGGGESSSSALMLHVELRCYQNFRQVHSHVVAYHGSQSWPTDMLLLLLLPVSCFLVVLLSSAQKKGPLITGQHLD